MNKLKDKKIEWVSKEVWYTVASHFTEIVMSNRLNLWITHTLHGTKLFLIIDLNFSSIKNNSYTPQSI